MKALEIHNSAEEELLNVFKMCIVHGENTSALVIGPRGSGKTFLIKKVICQMYNELAKQNCSTDFLLVNLSGCFQFDDKSALVEISKQLQLENVINDKVFGSFADSFEFLIRSFRSGSKHCKPLVFIMDEFDLFTKNKTQLLLYTLLNTIQTSPTPMCLLGVTCRIDVLDLLEKRIKSRFSHRQIYLFNDFDLTTYLDMAKYFLINNDLLLQTDLNLKLTKYLNEYINNLMEDSRVIKQFSRQYECDKSIASLKKILLLPAIKLSSMDKESLKQKDLTLIRNEIIKSFELFNIDTKFSLMLGLSILELSLVVVMLELSELYPEQPFNFDLAYNSYLKFCQKRNLGQQKYEKQIILKAYDHLISLNFILPANDYCSVGQSRTSKLNKEHSLMYLALDKEEIDKCLNQYPNCPTELQYYAKVN